VRVALCVAAFAALATMPAMTAGDSPLVAAVKSGDESAVRTLARNLPVVNAAGPDGMTALHWAARGDRLAILRTLLVAGAQVNGADRYGITPLALAAINGSAPVITALLDAGADARSRVGDGETVLMAAARTGRVDAARALLDRGADPNAREPWQHETALMWAAGENHATMVQVLVARGAELDARSLVPEFPKVKVDLATMVTTALPRGGLTALMLAARQGAADGALALIAAGAPLDSVDPDGTTALNIAIINAHFDVAALLIDKGADLNRADAAGMTPLYAAVDMQHQEPFVGRPLPKASGHLGARDVITRLLDRGANANAALRAPLLMRQHNTGDPSLGDGATALFRAAKVSDLVLMRELLGRGADPKLPLKNGTTVMMNVVARTGRNPPPEQTTIDAVALLLDHGADIQAANGAGQTALHAAVGRGDGVVRYLVERGARLDVKDAFNRTPLDVAMGVPGGGGRGRGGQPPGPGPVFKTTAALLKELMQ
jgi:uncharacterized protein